MLLSQAFVDNHLSLPRSGYPRGGKSEFAKMEEAKALLRQVNSMWRGLCSFPQDSARRSETCTEWRQPDFFVRKSESPS